MRAKEFGTNPKRPARAGSRPERGHNPQPRYTPKDDDTSDDWYDKHGNPSPHGAYDAGGHYHLDRDLEETARMSASVKLQRAFEREQAKSAASRKRGEEVMAQAKKDAENKSKEQKVSEYGDTAKGQKMLTKVQKRAVDRMIKADDKNDAKNAKKNQETANRAWDRMTDKDLEEARANTKAVRAGLSKREKRADPTMDAKKQSEQDAAWERLQAHMNKPENMDVLKRLATKEEQDVSESKSNAIANAAKRLTDPEDGKVAKIRAKGDQKREEQLKSRDIAKKNESMSEDNDPCWDGYKRKPGTKKFSKGSCVKVESKDMCNVCGQTPCNCTHVDTMLAELQALAEEGKASRALCKSSKPDDELGASQLASCKSQGLRARDGNKSHKLGKSPKSRVKVGGHKIKGHKYGGPLPDWS